MFHSESVKIIRNVNKKMVVEVVPIQLQNGKLIAKIDKSLFGDSKYYLSHNKLLIRKPEVYKFYISLLNQDTEEMQRIHQATRKYKKCIS